MKPSLLKVRFVKFAILALGYAQILSISASAAPAVEEEASKKADWVQINKDLGVTPDKKPENLPEGVRFELRQVILNGARIPNSFLHDAFDETPVLSQQAFLKVEATKAEVKEKRLLGPSTRAQICTFSKGKFTAYASEKGRPMPSKGICVFDDGSYLDVETLEKGPEKLPLLKGFLNMGQAVREQKSASQARCAVLDMPKILKAAEALGPKSPSPKAAGEPVSKAESPGLLPPVEEKKADAPAVAAVTPPAEVSVPALPAPEKAEVPAAAASAKAAE